jgi:hypothetical protein
MDAEHVGLTPGQVVPRWLRGVLGRLLPLDFSSSQIDQLALRGDPATPIITPAWKNKSISDYGVNSYPRTALNLEMLEKRVGASKMAEIMRTYVARFAFKHPRSEDFFSVASEVAKEDLTPFFNAFFRGTDRVDYAVEDIDCHREKPEDFHGFLDDGKGGVTYRGQDATKSKKKDDDQEGGPQRCRVSVIREGGAALPVSVRVTFEDGAIQVEHWDGQARWKHFDYLKEKKVKEVALNPEGRWAADETYANDGRTREANQRVPARFFGWITYLAQLALSALAFGA